MLPIKALSIRGHIHMRSTHTQWFESQGTPNPRPQTPFTTPTQCTNIKDIHEGVDFFFSHRAHGLKLIDFLQVTGPNRVVPLLFINLGDRNDALATITAPADMAPTEMALFESDADFSQIPMEITVESCSLQMPPPAGCPAWLCGQHPNTIAIN